MPRCMVSITPIRPGHQDTRLTHLCAVWPPSAVALYAKRAVNAAPSVANALPTAVEKSHSHAGGDSLQSVSSLFGSRSGARGFACTFFPRAGMDAGPIIRSWMMFDMRNLLNHRISTRSKSRLLQMFLFVLSAQFPV